MIAGHFELLVEEPSMEAFLAEVLPRMLNEATFRIHTHQGKDDLLRKLAGKLRAYSRWLPETARIIVLLDKDDDDCFALKERLEGACASANLASRSGCGHEQWRVANRIVIEELEAWFFGCWGSVRKAYPKVAPNVPQQAAYRQCDAIAGGTWEALERILKRGGYFAEGLGKMEAAREIGKNFSPYCCISPSFIVFRRRCARPWAQRLPREYLFCRSEFRVSLTST